MLARLRPSIIALAYAGFGVAWIVFSGHVLSFAVGDPALKDRIELGKGLAFVLVTSAMLYLLLRSRLSAAEANLATSRLIDRRYVTPLLVLSILSIPAVGLLVYHVQGKKDRLERLESLEAIAYLKVRQIQAWVADRRGDGIELAASTGFIADVRSLQAGTDAKARVAVLRRLNAVREVRGYESATLFDPSGKRLIVVGEAHDGKPTELPPVAGAGSRGGPWMHGPFRDAKGQLHLDFVVPLHGAVGEPVGTVLLHANPDRALFPMIETWPTANASGESNLVRRKGEAVEFINVLRFPADGLPAQELRVDSAKLVAAMAVRAGKPGASPGNDYRGMPILGAWRPVPGTDWHVVSKMDLHEAMAESREVALWVTLITFLATLIIGGAVVAYLRESQRVKELAMQADTDRLLRHFYQLPFVGMAITSPATRRWMQFNDSLCEILGYPRAELARMSWTEMTHPEDVTKDVAEFERVMRGETEGYAMEKRFVRKSGEVVYAEIDVKCVRLPDGKVDYFVATVRDVTERTRDRQRILRQSRFYSGLSACNAAIARGASEDELYGAVCRLAVESAGLKMAWVGIVDAEGMVQVHASFGRGEEYLQEIRVSVRADEPIGRGLTGTAIRENRPSWCDDFQNDSRTAPWHERAREYRWGSTAALPIRRGGIAIGALNIYSGEVGAFDEDARSLLLDMAANISFALDNFDREAARQRANEDLRAGEERFRLLFDRSLDAILLTDPAGGPLAANAAACRMLQRTEKELVSLGRLDIVDPADTRLAEAVARRERTGEFVGELTLRRKDGTKFEAEISTAVYRDGSGNVRSSMIIRDISERKRAEEAMERHIDELRRWNAVTLGREERILELKREVNDLLRGAGKPPHYSSPDAPEERES